MLLHRFESHKNKNKMSIKNEVNAHTSENKISCEKKEKLIKLIELIECELIFLYFLELVLGKSSNNFNFTVARNS
jgi:hypothetical protein